MLSKIFEDLNNENSVKVKKELLLSHKDNEDIKKILQYTLNPYKLFYMNKIPDFTANAGGITSFKKFFQLCDKLSNREIVGNNAKEEVKKLLETCSEKDAKLFTKVISKSAIGVGAKTVNKVWPNLVPEFKLMLAPNEIADVTNIHYPCAVQPKLDGYRCVYKDGQLWSRAGKPFGNKKLTEYFKCLENVGNYVLDGELYVHNLPFNKLTRILNAEDAELPKNLKYFVYDCVKDDYWESQKTTPTYETRLSRMREIINDRIADYTKVIDTSTNICSNPGEVLQFYKKCLKDTYEGVMIKNLNGSYQWKRVSIKSGEMVKLKPFKTEDLEIADIYDGEGNFAEIAGGVLVNYKNVLVRVGTGFNLETRKDMRSNPLNYIGKVIEVRYFEETEDGSLRFPSFVRFRQEKD